MKHIHYDNTTILTGDDIADAVIEYAAALAGGDRADTVAVPAIAPDGTRTTTKILIGPSSELIVEDADDDQLEDEDDEFVERLRAAARTFGHSEPIHANTRSDLRGVGSSNADDKADAETSDGDGSSRPDDSEDSAATN